MHDRKKILGNTVREYRTDRGLSQEKLAEILNLDQRTILNIEAGRGNPKFEVLYPLITYLKYLLIGFFILLQKTQRQNYKNFLPYSMTVPSKKPLLSFQWCAICLNYCESNIPLCKKHQ